MVDMNPSGLNTAGMPQVRMLVVQDHPLHAPAITRKPSAVLIVLLGVVLVLMFAPALVAMISVLDGHLMDRAAGWFRWQIGLVPFLVLGRLGSTVALGVIVSSAREDQ
jgi:hypothetical protein